MRSPKLMTWIESIESATLIVNGQCANIQRRSPLSFVCAKLADSLQAVQSENRVLAVNFFCGEHVSSREDPRNTPAGLINSLLAQLLSQCKHIDLTRVGKLGDFRTDNVDAVCKRFKKVLAQLATHVVVFCAVDGMSFYLDDVEREQESEMLVRRLIGFIKPRSGGCIFKLLLTAPRRLRTVGLDDSDEVDVLEVPERLGKGGGFRGLSWDLGAGQSLEG
ncbi:MAG: hypothetical protein Q9167_007352, partial [Letrouitia subvulpina]